MSSRVKVVAFDVWRDRDRAEFAVALKALEAAGVDIIDLYISPVDFGSMDDWLDALVKLLSNSMNVTTEPIRLLGFCAGGRLALEIAQRLATSGTPAVFVGLIDTWVRPPNIDIERNLYGRYSIGPSVWLPQWVLWAHTTSSGTWRAIARSLFSAAQRKLNGRTAPQHRQHRNEEDWKLMHFTHDRAIALVQCPVHLFNTVDSIAEHVDDPSLGLAPYLRGGFTVHELAGKHHTFTKLEYIDSFVCTVLETIGVSKT